MQMSEFRRPGLVPLQYKYNHTPYQPFDLSGIKVVDQTQVNTNSTTRVTLKSYTVPNNSAITKARIRLYVHINLYNGNWYLNINGTDVASGTQTSATKTLVVDQVFNVSAGQVIKVDGYTTVSGGYIYVDEVDIIYAGVILNSLTEVTLFSTTLTYTESGVDNQYVFAGDKVPTCYIKYHRKTTAAATLKFDVTTNNPAAADDGTAIQVVQIDGTHINTNNLAVALTGYVGASGDYILIVAVTMAVRHQYKHLDPWSPGWNENVFILYPNTLFYILAQKYSFFTLDGSSQALQISGIMSDGVTYYAYWYVSSANATGTTPDYNVVETGVSITMYGASIVAIITKLEISIAVAK